MQVLNYHIHENTIHDYSILAGFDGGRCISKAYIDEDSLMLNSIVIEQVNNMLLMAYAVYSDGSIHGLTLFHTAFVRSENAIFKKLQDAIDEDFSSNYAIEAIEVNNLIAKIIA